MRLIAIKGYYKGVSQLLTGTLKKCWANVSNPNIDLNFVIHFVNPTVGLVHI